MLRAFRVTLFLVGIGLCLIAAIWWLDGGRLYSVPTDSMIPAIRPGDAVLMSGGEQAVETGDVIVYRSPALGGQTVTHRIIGRQGDGSWLAKGDHNLMIDAPVSQQQIVGQVQAVAPKLGSVFGWLRTPLGLTLTVYLPALLAVMTIVLRTASAPVYRLRR